MSIFTNPWQTFLQRILFLSAFILSSFSPAFATHLAGGEIEYQNIGNRRWNIKLTVYRYCDNGATTLCGSFSCPQPITATPSPSIAQGGLNPNGCTANPGSIGATLQLQSVEDIGKENASRCGVQSKNTCTNLGQVAAGSYKPSIEKYVFTGVLDMSFPSLTSPATCPYWDIGWSYCCRNSTTNIQGQPNFYIQATLNISEPQATFNNNSPVFKNEAIGVFCAGQEYVFNMGASDPDRDSLTYVITKALQGPNQVVLYNGTFSESRPFPLNSTMPPHNAFLVAPFVVLDSLNGDLSLNALNTTTQPIGGDLAVKVIQWRYKEVEGVKVPYVVGITMRDLQLYSIPCLGNNPPRLITSPALPDGRPKFSWDVCAGQQLCFSITAKDTDFKPNNTPPRIDSTFITWDGSIVRPGKISFKRDYDTSLARPREDSWKFCWQTELSDTSTLPYYFTVRGMDNSCPDPGKITRAFSIRVNKLLRADLVIENNGCGKANLILRKTDVTQVFSTAVLEIANQPGDPAFAGGSRMINSANVNPAGTGSAPRAVINESVTFSQPGTYYIRYTVTAPQSTCIALGYDSIVVSAFSPVTVAVNDITKCKTGSINLSPVVQGGTSPIEYKWYRNSLNTSPVQASFSTASYAAVDSINAKYYIQVKDSNNCMAIDSMYLLVKRIDGNIIQVNQPAQCLTQNNFKFYHAAINGFSNYTRTWISETSSSTDSVWNTSFNTVGNKWIKLAISDAGCSDTAYASVNVWPQPATVGVLSINDSIQCLEGNRFILTYNPSANPYHYHSEWFYDANRDSNSNVLDLVYGTAGNKQVKLVLITVNGCKESILSNLVVKPSPVQPQIQGPQNGISVNDEVDYSVSAQTGNSYQWNVVNGSFVGTDTVATVRVKWTTAGEGKLAVRQELEGCEASDSITVEVGSTGLNELKSLSLFRIVPNPSNGKFTIQLESLTEQKISIKLADVSGVNLLNKTQHLVKGLNEIPVAVDAAAGVYLLTVSNGNAQTVRKIVISK